MRKTLDYLFLTSIGMVINPFLWFVLLGVLPLFYTERGELNSNGHFEPASLWCIIGGVAMMFVSGLYNYFRNK